MLNFILKSCFLLFFLFLATCQPIQYHPIDLTQSEHLLNQFSTKEEDISQRYITLRSGEKEFTETFLSNKLDLVFVLDTQPNMESFYQKNIFGVHFLNQFKDYDWKLAWTDMSMDIRQLAPQEEETGEEKKSCGFLKGLGMTIAGLKGGHPLLAGFGIDSLYNCFSSSKSSDKEEVFTNGSFLPFEYNGKKLKAAGFPKLTASVKNYNSIFDHSFRLKNIKGKKISYDAPEQRPTQSYPFASMALSMARGLEPFQNGQGSPFFRKDSVIIYVLVTTQDMQLEISPETFEQSIKSAFGSQERVKVIPVTLSPDSHIFCSLEVQSDSSYSLKIRDLAHNLGHKSLDICSHNLSEELFIEISKSLYRREVLSQ